MYTHEQYEHQEKVGTLITINTLVDRYVFPVQIIQRISIVIATNLNYLLFV